MPPRIAFDVLVVMVEDLKNGRTFSNKTVYDRVLKSAVIAIRRVHATQHGRFLVSAVDYRRHPGCAGALEAVQMIWPDKQGWFPFEPGCDPKVVASQPLLVAELPLQ